jgi:hypothetical protein
MNITSTTSPARFGIGSKVGERLAEKLIDLSRPGATIVDNSAEIIDLKQKFNHEARNERPDQR